MHYLNPEISICPAQVMDIVPHINPKVQIFIILILVKTWTRLIWIVLLLGKFENTNSSEKSVSSGKFLSM